MDQKIFNFSSKEKQTIANYRYFYDKHKSQGVGQNIESQIDFIKSLPKTDLHYHLDGSIRIQTLIEIAQQDSLLLPTYDIQQLQGLVSVSQDCKSLTEYLEKFDLPQLVFYNPENLVRIVFEAMEDAFKLGIKHMEIRFAPIMDQDDEFITEQRILKALEGISIGKEQFRMTVGLILCARRNQPDEIAVQVVNLAHKFQQQGVVAVDLAGDENMYPPVLHERAFKIAKNYNIKITIHAGETGISQNIIDSIILLHADRIGHGVAAIKDESVIKLLKERNIPLEICIKSNLDTKIVENIYDHPILALFKLGVKVTINTDNTTVSNTNIMKEYEQLLKIGFTLKEIVKIVRNGIESSFITKQEKNYLIEELNEKENNLMEQTIIEEITI